MVRLAGRTGDRAAAPADSASW